MKMLLIGSHDVLGNSAKWLFPGDRSFPRDHLAEHNQSSVHSRALRRRDTLANGPSGILSFAGDKIRDIIKAQDIRKPFGKFVMCNRKSISTLRAPSNEIKRRNSLRFLLRSSGTNLR